VDGNNQKLRLKNILLLEGTRHEVRMDQGRRVKKIISKSEGSRKTGRPTLRWPDYLREDLREMKVKRWRQKAVGGEEWASVIKKGRAVRGPYSRGVSKDFFISLHRAL